MRTAAIFLKRTYEQEWIAGPYHWAGQTKAELSTKIRDRLVQSWKRAVEPTLNLPDGQMHHLSAELATEIQEDRNCQASLLCLIPVIDAMPKGSKPKATAVRVGTKIMPLSIPEALKYLHPQLMTHTITSLI